MSALDQIVIVNPDALGTPRGYANGMRVPAGRDLLFIAGQIGWDADQTIAAGGFAQQFGQALENVLTVVREADGEPTDIVSMTIYVTDKQAYLGDLEGVKAMWRSTMGRHYPTMALVEVRRLVEDDAMVEIQAVAALAMEGDS